MAVLIVDDNIILLQKIARSVARIGYDVATAISILHAREVLRSKQITVICLDLQLPDGHGLDLLDDLRSEHSDIPVIVMSGANTPQNRTRAERLGVIAFLTKPFALAQLNTLLGSLDPSSERKICGDVETTSVCRPSRREKSVSSKGKTMSITSYTTNQFKPATAGLNQIKLGGHDVMPLALAIVFLAATWWAGAYFVDDTEMRFLVIASAVIGGYMALNIGANDVANNVAAAVGSRALTLGGAVVLAVIFETAGALIAGGDVVSTISKGIIDPALMANATVFILAMSSALLAAAMWLNLATWLGAPVSTTHSIVGAVMGAGIAAAGFGVVNWLVMAKIAASWFISPVLGGVIAALFLAAINRTIFRRTTCWTPADAGYRCFLA